MDWVYEPALRILDRWRDYRKMAQIHAKLSEAMAKIDNGPPLPASPNLERTLIASADKRVFGTYFRVGFYGYK